MRGRQKDMGSFGGRQVQGSHKLGRIPDTRQKCKSQSTARLWNLGMSRRWPGQHERCLEFIVTRSIENGTFSCVEQDIVIGIEHTVKDREHGEAGG